MNELPAGRELDALIAKNVMGESLWLREPREYSTDIAAAWEVVEKMQPHSLHLWAPHALINDEMGEYAKQWTAQFVAWMDGRATPLPANWYGLEAEAETAPLAICRAALKVVG